MADGELNVKLVPDEQALEQMEEKQLEISGEPDSVGEAKRLNEEQNNKLQVMTRRLGRIGSRLGQIAVVATLLAALVKIVGEVFNIGFEDVRNAIVTILNDIKNVITGLFSGIGNFFGGGASNFTGAGGDGGFGAGQLLAGGLAGPAGLGLFNLLSNDSDGGGASSSNQGQANVNLLTSRDALLGDSTQREMNSQNTEDFVINGGS